MKKNTTNKFLIGSWVSFYSFDIDSYEYQLDKMREAGLNFNIFPEVTIIFILFRFSKSFYFI